MTVKATGSQWGTASVGLSPRDKWEIGLAKTFRLTSEPKMEEGRGGMQRVAQGATLPSEVPAFRGLRDAYIEYTGDGDLSGRVDLMRVTQIYNNAGFPSALANVLNLVLMKNYGAPDYRWRDIVTSVTAPSDFRAQERVRVGGMADLDELGEDALYDEIEAPGDEKISYTVGTRGGTLTITRRMLINDNIGLIAGLVQQAGRAADRTLARFVWDFAISNAIYDADGLDWFHGTHGNLGSTALTTPAAAATEFTAICKAMFSMTEKDSGEKLGLVGPYLLVVPIDLGPAAKAWNQAQYVDAVFTPNPYYHFFGVNNERIFVNPLLTDPSDWYIFDISGDVQLLEVGFLNGRQAPEFVLAAAAAGGAMFTQDRLVYKVRHEYSGDILDYRGAFKEVVA